jgi:hypothetical protein
MSRDAVGRIGLSGNLKVTKKGPAADLEARVYAEVRGYEHGSALAQQFKERAERTERTLASVLNASGSA